MEPFNHPAAPFVEDYLSRGGVLFDRNDDALTHADDAARLLNAMVRSPDYDAVISAHPSLHQLRTEHQLRALLEASRSGDGEMRNDARRLLDDLHRHGV